MKSENQIKYLFIFSVILILSSINFAQDKNTDKNVLPAPLKELVAVHHPDLKGVEEDVRQQIVSFQESLAETAKASQLNLETLSNSYATMGKIYHAYSFFDAAAECYLNASVLSPKDFRWNYLLGKISDEANKKYEAIDFYKKAQTIQPEYLPIYVNLGNAYLELDLLGIARESFENALKLNKEYPSALYGLGQVNFAENKFEEAALLFEKVLTLVPEANRVHYSLALAYRNLKYLDKAKIHLAKQGSVGVRPSDPVFDELNDLKKGIRLRLLRGKLAVESGRFADAEIEFQKVLAAEPENVTALVNYGVALVQVKKYAEALVYFDKAVRLSPKNLNALYNLATLLSLQKQHFPAIQHLKTILEINPKDISARFLLAKELRDADLLQESTKEFIAVYNSNPDNEEVLLESVKLLIKKGEHKQAKDLLEKSYTKFPERQPTAATLAYLLATSPQTELRDGQKALEISQKIYDSTKLLEYGAIVAMSFAELDKCEEAAKLTKELLENATKSNDKNSIAKLKTELNRYENEKPCRVK